MKWLSKVLWVGGFDPAVLQELSPFTRSKLTLLASLRLMSVLVVASAVGFAVFASTGSQWFGGLAALLALFVAGRLMMGVVRLRVAAGAPGVIRGEEAARNWRPSVFWVAFMLVLTAMTAQPALLALNWGLSERQLGTLIDERVLLNYARQRQVIQAGDNILRLQRAKANERLANDGSTLEDVASRRKALVIGAQTYRMAGPLNNPAKDARDLAAKFEQMGFDVTLSVDDEFPALQVAIHRYIESLQPGDISVLYYSGHGYQSSGHNFILPIDFNGADVQGIPVTPILEAINQRSPQMQVLLLDACRNYESDDKIFTGGLALVEGAKDSFFAMAAEPGKSALDGEPGANGLFTAAILRYIDQPDDIEALFRRIKDDVYNASLKVGFEQRPVTTNSLTDEYVQLVDPAIATPRIASPGAEGRSMLGEQSEGRRDLMTEVCPPLPGLAVDRQREHMLTCLRQRVEGIDSLLADWQDAAPRILLKNATAYRASLEQSGLLSERLAYLWATAPGQCALWTLFFVVFLNLSELVGLFYRKEIGSYLAGRNRLDTTLLEASFMQATHAIDRRLGTARHASWGDLHQEFLTVFNWQGPVEKQPLWSLELPKATTTRRAAVHKWLERGEDF